MKSSLVGRWSTIFFVLLLHFLFSNINTHLNAQWRIGSSAISGRVISEWGPLENARVRLPGYESFVLTDRQGRFLLPLEQAPRNQVRITAGKEGWFNNGRFVTPGGRVDIYLYPVLRADHPGYKFISPVTCAKCHVKISKFYDRSKMAHTTSNPLVLQMYNGTDALNRAGKGPGYKPDNPGNDGKCIYCHAPSIAISKPKSWDLNQALVSPQAEWDGISCDFCHKIKRIIKNQNSPSGFKAIHERQQPWRGAAILAFGPYDDVSVPPMAASYNPLFDRGQLCSLCHSHIRQTKNRKKWNWQKVYTKTEWKGFGLKDNRLPIQTTYQEWKAWQSSLEAKDPNKGKICQDCHMSWRKEMLPYDNYVIDGHVRQMWGTYRSTQSIHPHKFSGGTATQLKTALSLELEGKIENNTLTVNAFVTNTNGGHWVPTGETMRSVILLVEVASENGRQLKRIAGQRLPDWTGTGKISGGNYAGLSGVVFARVLEDDKGNLNVPFWRASSIASDTRIRPKTTLNLEWKFSLDDPEDEATVTATLIYRPVHKNLAKSKQWDTNDIIIAKVAW